MARKPGGSQRDFAARPIHCGNIRSHQHLQFDQRCTSVDLLLNCCARTCGSFGVCLAWILSQYSGNRSVRKETYIKYELLSSCSIWTFHWYRHRQLLNLILKHFNIPWAYPIWRNDPYCRKYEKVTSVLIQDFSLIFSMWHTNCFYLTAECVVWESNFF